MRDALHTTGEDASGCREVFGRYVDVHITMMRPVATRTGHDPTIEEARHSSFMATERSPPAPKMRNGTAAAVAIYATKVTPVLCIVWTPAGCDYCGVH